MRSRRALLYVPGNDTQKIKKAAGLEIDCVCMDMEDGVAWNQKDAARQTIRSALDNLDFGRSERLARINPVGSGLESLDINAVLRAHPDGIVIPKVENCQQVRWASEQISTAEQLYGWRSGEICLLVGVETASGILNLREIVASDSRLQGIIFGAEDLAADIGAIRTPQAWEVFYARSAVIIHTAADNLHAIDMVFTNYKDPDGLYQEALIGAQLGFTGKQIIHPDQVGPVQSAFTPSDQAIAEALKIVEVFEESQSRGNGAFGLDGKMVDLPVVKTAQRLLARARAAGKIK